MRGAGSGRFSVQVAVLLLALACVAAHAAPVAASELLDKEERAAIRRVIRAQIEALRRDDAEEAFSFAAPAVRQLFGTPERFFAMVKDVYRPLYRPRSVTFLELELIAGEYTQKVLVVDSDGAPRLAAYLMSRQPDDSWKILGCVLRPVSLDVTSLDEAARAPVSRRERSVVPRLPALVSRLSSAAARPSSRGREPRTVSEPGVRSARLAKHACSPSRRLGYNQPARSGVWESRFAGWEVS